MPCIAQVLSFRILQDARSREENWSSARRKWGHRAGRGGGPPGKQLEFAGPPSAEMSLRTPDLAQGFWAAEENDLTRIYRSGWLLRAALKEKLVPCRSFSCRSFRRV